MSSKSEAKFPLEIRKISDAETAEAFKDIKEGYMKYFIRVGPHGYFFSDGFIDIIPQIYNMELRPDDIFVASFPKAGTTWVQELVWMIANNCDYETAKTVSLVERFPFLEFIKTHFPLSLLPPDILDRAKVVYVARDPRDIAVSYFHHQKILLLHGYKGEFKNFWKLFIKDMVEYSPFFSHFREAWALRNHPNMLLLFYEELSKDMPDAIRRVTDFLGKSVSEEKIAGLCEHLKFENFRKNKAVNYENLKDLGIMEKGENFIWKGKAGGWRDYFDEEMAAEAEMWMEEGLRGIDFKFTY